MDVRMPDGTIITNVPDDITKEELLSKYQASFPAQPDDAANFQLAKDKFLFGEESQVTRNPFEAFKGSLKGVGESARQAVETPIYGSTEAFERSQQRREDITEKPGFSLEQIEGEFERGTIPGLIETAKQIPSGFGTYLGYAFPSLVAYAGAPLVGLKGTIGRLFAAGSTSLLPQFGEGMTRQAEVQLERGEPVDIDVAKALYTAVGQAALDVIPINKILGPLVTPKKLKDAEKIIKSKPNKTLEAVSEGLLTAELEAGTEITQQLLERWQAGLPLFDEEAIKEYKEVGALSLFAGPLGAYSGYTNVKSSEDLIKDDEKRVARIKRINEQRDVDEFNKVQAMRDDIMDRWDNRKSQEKEDQFEQLQNIATEVIDGVEISLPVKSKLLSQLKKYQADYDKAEAKEKEKIAKQAIDDLTDIPKDFVKTLDLSPLRLIDKKLIRDLGVAPNSAAARNILGLDPTNPAHADKITSILKNYLETLKTSPTANAERAQQAEVEITAYLNKIGAEVVDDRVLETGAGSEEAPVNPLLKELISSDTFLPLPSDPDAKLQYLRNVFAGNPNLFPVQAVDFEEDVAAGDIARYEQDYNNTLLGKKKSAKFKEIQDESIIQPTQPDREGTGAGVQIPGESLRDLPAAELAETDRSGIIGPPSYVRELEGRIEQQRASLKDIKKQEREFKSQTKLTQPTLKQFLSKPENRISRNDLLDVMGETKVPVGNPGYFRGFSNNPQAQDLMTRIELGKLDSYLPPELQSTYEDPATGLGFDSRAAYDFIAEAMRSDEEVLHMEDQDAVGMAREQLGQVESQRANIESQLQEEEQNLKVERANEDLVDIDRERRDIKPMESRQRAPLSFEGKPIPRQLIDRYRINTEAEERANVNMSGPNKAAATRTWQSLSKAYTDFLGVDPNSQWTTSPRFYALQDLLQQNYKPQEARQAEITEETPASIIDAMKKVFGENVAKGIKSGLINIVPTADALPQALQRQLSPTARAAFVGDKAYFIADRITREAAPQMLLHEIGAHYGLERMLGKNYKNIVTNLINNKDKDKQIKQAFEETLQYYPDLDVNSPDFIQEVIANLGERAPKNTLFQRVMNVIRNFLTKLGYGWNTKNLSAQDIANMVQLSTIQSLKDEGRYKTGRHSSLALASDENVEAPMFYSALKRAVINAKQDKMPRKQWASWLRSNAPKLGIKQAELDATGILDMLEAMDKSESAQLGETVGPLSKGDLISIINSNAIELSEKIYGAGSVEAVDAPDRQDYIDSIVEEWRDEKREGLEERIYQEAYENADLPYAVRELNNVKTKVAENGLIELVDQDRDTRYVLEQMASNQAFKLLRRGPQDPIPPGEDSFNNVVDDLKQGMLGQIRRNDGQVFFVENTAFSNLTDPELPNELFDSESQAEEMMIELNDVIIDQTFESMLTEALRDIDQQEGELRDELVDRYNEEYGEFLEGKYKTYTLPGGSDYTELLILNPKAKQPAALSSPMDLEEGETRAPAVFSSSHFDPQNIIAHVRMTTRPEKDSSKSVLFVEEIQSDWGQQGRRLGFKRLLNEDEKAEIKKLQEKLAPIKEKLDAKLNESEALRTKTGNLIQAYQGQRKEQPEILRRISDVTGLNFTDPNKVFAAAIEDIFFNMLNRIAAIPTMQTIVKNYRNIDPRKFSVYEDDVINAINVFSDPTGRQKALLGRARDMRGDTFTNYFIAEALDNANSYGDGFGFERGEAWDLLGKINEVLNEPEFKTFAKRFDGFFNQMLDLVLKREDIDVDRYSLQSDVKNLDYQIREIKNNVGSIPVAPFVTDTKAWTELAIKRVARYAVDKGYDKVAFMNGIQSSKLYSLGRSFEELAITRSEDGKTYRLDAAPNMDQFDQATPISERVEDKDLENYVGTDLAKKARQIDPGITDIFSAGDLQLPSKSFEQYYDKIIPSVVKKLTKQIGGEPKVFDLDSSVLGIRPTGTEAIETRDIGNQAGLQQGFEITPEMKKNIQGGMPLFSKQPKVLESRQRPDEVRDDGTPIKYYTDDRTRLQKALDAIKGSTPNSRKSTWQRFTDMLGVKIIGGRYTVERKAIDEDLPEVSAKQQGRIRGDLINLQALNLVALAQSGLFRGRLKRNPSGMIIADESTGPKKVGVLDVTTAWNDLLTRATEDLGSEAKAYDLLVTGWYGPRYQEIKKYNETVSDDEKINIDEWTESDQKTYLEAYKKYGQELKDIRDMRNIMRKDVLDFLVQTGLYTREKAQDYLDKLEYVALYRVPEDALAQYENAPFRQGRGLLGAGKEYRLLGSDRAAADPLENFATNMSWLMQRGIKNNAVKATADLLQDLGQGEYMTRPMTPGERKALHHVLVYVDGKPKEFVVDDPNDMAAFASAPVISNFFLNLLNFPVRTLRRGITMMPQFVWNQSIEDPIRATLVAGNKAGILKNIANTWKSIAVNQFKADLSPNADMLNRYGIIGQKDILDSQDIIDRYKGKDKNNLSKYLFFFERLSHGSDLGARESIYQEAIKELQAKGYDQQTAEDYAALKALQYLPYQQIGQSRTMGYLRRMMPFINPPIQGMFREIEAMRGRVGDMTKAEGKKAFLWRLGKYLAFTAMYTAFRSGDDDYENETDYNRDNNFFIGGIRFAVPRELAPLKVAIERGTRAYVLNHDKADIERPEVAGAIIRKFWELGAGFLPMPTFATPIIENITNFDLFTSRPLVSPSLARREPRYQFNDNTSEIAKVIGNYLNVSPIKVDNLLRGYLGYLGATLGEFTNYMASDRPDKRPNDLLFIGNIIQNEFGTGPRQRFYKLYDKVNEATATVKFFEGRGDAEGLKEYVAKNKGYLGIATEMNKINQELSKIRQARRYITGSDRFSSAEKRARLDKLEKVETKMLNSVMNKLDRTAMKYNK